MMQFPGNGRRPSSQRIRALILQETGTYNEQFLRPYQSHMEHGDLSNIQRVVEETNPQKITGSLFTGHTANLIAPAANVAGQVPIENGWNTRRCRFVLIVDFQFTVGSRMSYYFQGYTSHSGIGNDKSIDPQMVFFINSFMGTVHNHRQTPMGMVESEQVVESSRVLSDHNLNDSGFNRGGYLMRPMDIFTGMQVNDQLMPGLYDDAHLQPGEWVSPIADQRSMLTSTPSASTRKNDIAPQYIARVVDGFVQSQTSGEFGDSEQSIYSDTKSKLSENYIISNPFFNLLSQIYGVDNRSSFTYQDLMRIDANVDKVKMISFVGTTQQSQLNFAGDSEHWYGSNRESVVATMISNAVPALMLEYMISKIALTSNNHQAGGVPNTNIIGAKSLSNADMTREYQAFIARFEQEVLYDITWGNQETVMVNIEADIFGDTIIEISLGGKALTRFVTPSFCDSLMSNVISPNDKSYMALVSDFDQLMHAVSDARSGSSRGFPGTGRYNF